MADKAFTTVKKTRFIYAVLLLGIFTFLYLGSMYLYVNMTALTANAKKAVIAQNYALGAGCAGFLLYPLFHRLRPPQKARGVWLFFFSLAAAVCIFLILGHISYLSSLLLGMVLFLFLGLLGGAVHYLFFKLAKERDYLARLVGISYALGIFLQFLCNNLVNIAMVEAMILSLFSFITAVLLAKAEMLCRLETTEKEEGTLPAEKGETGKTDRKKTAAGWLLALIVFLMACVFSTLDNAVTLQHAAGTSIGKWPRLLLAASGLAAGFIFDIRKRKLMPLIMYCVLMLSVICVVVIKMGGPFGVGLLVFYLSAGFFSVFFTTSFVDLARHMKMPTLWTGMGRAMNNASAALFTHGSVSLLMSDSHGMATIILTLTLFVLISVLLFLYSACMPTASDPPDDIPTDLDPREALCIMSELFGLTSREIEVFDKLVNSEETVQEIADSLYLSRRTCQRYIASVYEKAGVKSRMGLYQLYINKQLRI